MILSSWKNFTKLNKVKNATLQKEHRNILYNPEVRDAILYVVKTEKIAICQEGGSESLHRENVCA